MNPTGKGIEIVKFLFCSELMRRYQEFVVSAKAMNEPGDEPEWLEMPSISNNWQGEIEPGEGYHDLGQRYPDAPVPRISDDVIVHRAILEDLSGIGPLIDWVSDGDIVIIELTELLDREMELHLAVEKIHSFIEGDIRGEVVRLGNTRLLLLPANFKSVSVE
jgi:SepF-like predicted cell division protein (DUF552 family)|tara:strand:+ start:2997 stop:3482 length:486 start_codon:yes stop_codon:yes gene_type:complete